jgi:hypothetical protein
MYEGIKPGHADRSHATVNFSASRYSYFFLILASRLKMNGPDFSFRVSHFWWRSAWSGAFHSRRQLLT